MTYERAKRKKMAPAFYVQQNSSKWKRNLDIPRETKIEFLANISALQVLQIEMKDNRQ